MGAVLVTARRINQAAKTEQTVAIHVIPNVHIVQKSLIVLMRSTKLVASSPSGTFKQAGDITALLTLQSCYCKGFCLTYMPKLPTAFASAPCSINNLHSSAFAYLAAI